MGLEVLITAPFNLLIKYPNDNEDIFIENPIFFTIRQVLQIELNTIQWANECYDILAGKRELQRIKLFYDKSKKNYILLDNYFDPLDQLDTISIGIKGADDVAEELRKVIRMLFEDCEYKIGYYEGNGQVFRYYPIDEITKKRYLKLPDNRVIKGQKIEII